MSNKSNKFRPLLAATVDTDEQLEALNYPMWGSPKVDGIRVLIQGNIDPPRAVTRSLKPVRNAFIQNYLGCSEFQGFDGEVCVGPITAPDVFNRTTSGVMSEGGSPDFTYWVFDCSSSIGGFSQRFGYTALRVQGLNDPRVKLLPHTKVRTPEEVLTLERAFLEQGFEGIMLRSPDGPYKHNRSTLREQTLLKLKRFEDNEAIITGFEELQRNTNLVTLDSLGLSERSEHKSGMRPANTLGALVVDGTPWGEFRVGSGFDEALRDKIWQNQAQYLGRRITYRYQKVGVVDKPRFPTFKGFRPQE